jgi:soluble lytic murein transglycosylase-like protein
MTKAGVILMFTVLTVHAGLSQLDAISMIESGNNDAAVGRAGEVSRYQIRPQVWHRISQSREYENPRVAEQVAQQHLDWLAKFFSERTGRTADDFDLYVMWNAGPTYYSNIGFSRERVRSLIRNRAERYVNLREMRTPNTAATATVTPAIARK